MKPTKRWLLVLDVGWGIELHGKSDVDMASPMTIDRHIIKFVSDKLRTIAVPADNTNNKTKLKTTNLNLLYSIRYVLLCHFIISYCFYIDSDS